MRKQYEPEVAKQREQFGPILERAPMPNSIPEDPIDYQSILDSITDGVLTVDRDMIITSFNRAAVQITQVPQDEAIGRHCFEVMRSEACERDCCIKKTFETGQFCKNVPVYIVRRIVGGVETFKDLSELHKLRRAYRKQHSFEDIISKNHRMLELFAILPQVAKSRSTVLIEGPSGTGKELFARAIHNHSSRHSGPFLAINCGALPDTLIESELFGYRAGAFTDAKNDKPGLFAQARGGTLFLDEIGDISPAMQMRLLRALENRVYTPLGATQPEQMDARVIAATHRDLQELVARNRFREDLFFRINIVRLKLPKLSERKEDIPLLVDHFIKRYNTLTGKQIIGVSHNALAALDLYDWPGNVRELENAIEHAFVLCRQDVIGTEHLPEQIQPLSDTCPEPDGTTLKEIEKAAIIRALIRNDWRRVATARELGVDKNTLRRKILRYEIEDPNR